jgi:hypothetical protein
MCLEQNIKLVRQVWARGLGQGHNQKKDTHTVDFDVTVPLGLKQLTSLIFHFAKGFLAKNVSMTGQRDFGLGNSPFGIDWLEPSSQNSFRRGSCQDKTLVSCWYFLVSGSFIISFA